MRRFLALLSAGVPFIFGAVRAIQTRSDYRYLAVAFGALGGGLLITAVARQRLASSVPLVIAVFVVATICAVVTAMALGTRLGPGLLVVASGFGVCFATSAALSRT